MKIIIQKESLLSALSQTVPITKRSTPLPVLTHVLIDIQESPKLSYIISNSLDIGIKAPLSLTILEPGQALLPGAKFLEIVQSLPIGPNPNRNQPPLQNNHILR